MIWHEILENLAHTTPQLSDRRLHYAHPEARTGFQRDPSDMRKGPDEKEKYECEMQSLWTERRVSISCHLLMPHACPYPVSVSTS